MKRLSAGITIVFGFLIILVCNFIFPPCTGELELVSGGFAPMKCHWSAIVDTVIGALIVVVGILLFMAREPLSKLAAYIIILAHSLAALLIPTVIIGVCSSVKMQCRIATLPALSLLSIALIVSCAINIVIFIKGELNSKKDG